MNEQMSLKEYTIRFLKRYKVYLISLISISFLVATSSILVQYQTKTIIDTITDDKHASLGYALALFIGYKLAHHGAFFLRRCLGIYYEPLILVNSITDIYTQTTNHSLHWFDSHLSGEISSKISDFQNSITVLIMNCAITLSFISMMIIGMAFLIHVHYLTAIVLGVFIVIYLPIVYFLLKKQMLLQEQNVKAKQKAIGIINDSIANIFSIKTIGHALDEFKFKLLPSLHNWRDWDQKTRKFDTYVVDNVDTLMMLIMSFIQIYLLTYLYKNEAITAGGFAFISMITLNIHWQLDGVLHNLLFVINPAIAQIKSSYEFVNAAYDVRDKNNAKVLQDVKGSIIYKDVDFIYPGNSEPVLKEFNVHIKAGERVGVVGTSGAGKTTFVKCLLRYFDVSRGSICIDAQNITNVTQESLRDSVAIIPQDITMFHRSIRDNLELAKYGATDEEIIAACKKAKIHDEIMSIPNNYDSIVGERGVKLSGGQRQRVAIARAILKNTPILILDEATSSLDTMAESLIQKSIDEILKTSNATVIAIAHRLSTLKHMDRIIVLDSGKIIEEGTHNTLINNQSGLYKKLWDMQAI